MRETPSQRVNVFSNLKREYSVNHEEEHDDKVKDNNVPYR